MLKVLGEKNRKTKQLFAYLSLDKQMMQDYDAEKTLGLLRRVNHNNYFGIADGTSKSRVCQILTLGRSIDRCDSGAMSRRGSG